VADSLFAEVEGAGPRIVLVHGFTQTRACWGPLPARLVEAGFEVVRVDLPGHGRSGTADSDLWATAGRLGATGGTASYLGYSFGARVCLHLALTAPALVERLVLVGGTAGIESTEQRAERRTADEALADRIEAIGVAAFLDEWLALPLFAGLSEEAACRDARLENTASGLAGSLRACGTGTQESLWSRLAELTMPVLGVAGADDARFGALADRLAREIGANAASARVPAAGHTAHLEAPDAFWEVLASWLAAPSDA
jgi:2-succinyl-6-hydroxy-2,4-cyclohexadiene-1-carboxylate synthase